MKVVRLSTLRTGRLYTQEIFLVLFSVHCATSQTVLGSIPGVVTGDISVVPPTEPCALRSTQPLKVSTRDLSRGEFRPRQTRQLPRAVDLKGRLLSCQSY